MPPVKTPGELAAGLDLKNSDKIRNRGSIAAGIDRLAFLSYQQYKAVADPPGYLEERQKAMYKLGEAVNQENKRAYDQAIEMKLAPKAAEAYAESRSNKFAESLLEEFNDLWPAAATQLGAAITLKSSRPGAVDFDSGKPK